MKALTISDLSHFYGEFQSLYGIDLACPAQQITCLLGPSGCGKSTLLRCIAGHESPISGSIHLGEEPLVKDHHSLPPEARGVGMVFQDYALFPHLKVWQNAAFGLHKLPRKQRRKRACEVLDRMEIGELADRYPHTCSGGQQQRVALARALAPHPSALLLDEPFSGLDSGLRASLRHEIRDLLLKEELPTVLVTHDPEEALCCADQIVLMQEGRIAQIGSPDTIWHEPATADVMGFFSPIVRLDATVQEKRCTSPLGSFPMNLPDGDYDLAVRVDALTADVEGEIQAPILSQNACGGHRHVTLDLKDGVTARFQVTNQGSLPSEMRFHLDQSRMRIFSRKR
jgi:iron(III) transport system ATP-binding protein